VSGYDAVLAALQAQELVVNSWGENISARCPSHEDQTPSLSLRRGDDERALLFCHAGCDIRDVVQALDLSMTDLFSGSEKGAIVATYEYGDENDEPLYRVMRLSPKGFFQERWEENEWKAGLREVRRVPYRLSRLIGAVEAGREVYIVEGEKDADNLISAYDVVATTLLGGANKWREEYGQFFRGAKLVVVGDSDEQGRLHVATIKSRLGEIAASIRVYYPRVGKDVSDHILAGFTLEDLQPEGEGLDEFIPLDWEHYEVPETNWLYEPYIPRQGRVLAFGPAGSLKSLWAMWVGAKLAEEGKRVAYFSLEMLPSQTAQRLRQLKPPRENFQVFTNLKLGSPAHTSTLIAGLKGVDLIVIDSWSSARAHKGRESNEDIAELDNDVLLPIINLTGAAVLIIDNTGHAVFTDKGKFKQDHARGASAKGDKMEVTLWFDRPYEADNYQTKLTVKKMRLDYQMPAPLVMKTPTDRIEFYHVNSETGALGQPVWPTLQIISDAPATDVASDTEDTPTLESMEVTPQERRALARVRDMFKVSEPEASV